MPSVLRHSKTELTTGLLVIGVLWFASFAQAGSCIVSSNQENDSAVEGYANIHAIAYHVNTTSAVNSALAKTQFGKPIIVSDDGSGATTSQVNQWSGLVANAWQNYEHLDDALVESWGGGAQGGHVIDGPEDFPADSKTNMARLGSLATPLAPNGALTRVGGEFRWNGQRVRLMGSSWYGAMLGQNCDINAYLDVLHSYGVNFTRVWVVDMWTALAEFNNYNNGILPFTGSFGSYNLSQLNDAFFTRAKAFVDAAWARGIVVQLTMFDRCGLQRGHDFRFNHSPYNAANNNGDFLTCSSSYPAFTGTDGTQIGAVNRPLIERLVSELGSRRNVIFEIMNEPLGSFSNLAAWHQWVADIVHTSSPQSYLKIHPRNSHYFQDNASGKAVLIASCGTVAPSSSAIDYTDDINLHSSHGMPYARIWHMLPWETSNAIWPWARSGTAGAYMGGNKFDMNSWNSTYWSRINDCLSKTNAAGMYSEIMFFDRCGMSPASRTRWGNNPWASDNNINSLEVPSGANDGTPEFYSCSSKTNLRNQQERYIKKMIDETIAYPKVIYEIENEHWEAGDPAWASHYSQFVKDYIASHYSGSPRLVSYSSLETDLEACYGISTIDIVNKHFDGDTDPAVYNTYIETRWANGKAINIDEFANGFTDYNILRRICWTIVASGGHFHIEDAQSSARPYDVVSNIQSFLMQSRWDFVHAAPNKALVTSGGGYCMAQSTQEYVCYFTSGGGKTISLASGDYTARWWNPRDGGFSGDTSFSHGGRGRTFSTPDSNDWVLQITRSTGPPAETLTVIPNAVRNLL